MIRNRITGPLGLSCVLVAVTAAGQQPGKPEDLREFARPKSLCSIQRTDPRAALQELVALVEAEGFSTTAAHWAQGDFEGSKADGSSQDRVLLWLERDLDQPTKQLDIFLIYGRFEKFLGATDLKRVVAEPDFEELRIGSLKRKIFRHALGG